MFSSVGSPWSPVGVISDHHNLVGIGCTWYFSLLLIYLTVRRSISPSEWGRLQAYDALWATSSSVEPASPNTNSKIKSNSLKLKEARITRSSLKIFLKIS